MHRSRSSVLALSGLLLLAACSDDPTAPHSAELEPPHSSSAQSSLDAIFVDAAREFNVPVSLLKGIGYTETRWQMVQGQQEFEGMPAAFGVMALRGDRLELGAKLAGVTAEAARSDARANIRAGAALLSSYAKELGITGTDPGAWAPAVARYSGIESTQGQAAYVHNGVYAVLREGAVARNPSGELVASLMPSRVSADFAKPSFATTAATDPYYPATVWRGSPNYNARPAGSIGKVAMVVIHTCEGTYYSCWSWLTNSAAGASAHYVVNESGSEVSQLVSEANRAWHVGATYYCSNNAGVDCWRDGYSSNHFTIGIEHGGYASQSSFPAGQIDKSARLSCGISNRYGIPRDRYHFLSHAQLQPYNRTDPGPNWPWSTYLSKINSYCGTGGTAGLIVDSNNTNNNAAQARFETSASWASGSSSPGYYGSDYAWASTQAISDGAAFWFYLPAAATKTVDAWWTAGANRASSAPFVAFNAAGTRLGTAYGNQQANGGKWNQIGTWNFSAGWNRIELSRWTTSGDVVIADAVRIR